MSAVTPFSPQGSVMARVIAAKSPAERARLQLEVMEAVDDERFDRPVPRFMAELPYGGDTEGITDRIASAILVADDPSEAEALAKVDSSQDLLGEMVTIHDLVTMPSDKPGGWGAYLLLEVTMGGAEERRVISTGAKQAIVRIVREAVEHGLPITGGFSEVEGTGRRGSPALTFKPIVHVDGESF